MKSKPFFWAKNEFEKLSFQQYFLPQDGKTKAVKKSDMFR